MLVHIEDGAPGGARTHTSLGTPVFFLPLWNSYRRVCRFRHGRSNKLDAWPDRKDAIGREFCSMYGRTGPFRGCPPCPAASLWNITHVNVPARKRIHEPVRQKGPSQVSARVRDQGRKVGRSAEHTATTVRACPVLNDFDLCRCHRAGETPAG